VRRETGKSEWSAYYIILGAPLAFSSFRFSSLASLAPRNWAQCLPAQVGRGAAGDRCGVQDLRGVPGAGGVAAGAQCEEPLLFSLGV